MEKNKKRSNSLLVVTAVLIGILTVTLVFQTKINLLLKNIQASVLRSTTIQELYIPTSPSTREILDRRSFDLPGDWVKDSNPFPPV